ncbi:EndoU domain-containing protein [Kitasatospora sp. NPDC058046]|uniref:EndoU domain-containing protein n=1 Tax=Kitasatospora sp. NPDC058046 TaxID=3346312 RepID=UPI0036D7E419
MTPKAEADAAAVEKPGAGSAARPRVPEKPSPEVRGEEARLTAQKHAEVMDRWLEHKRQDPETRKLAEQRAEEARQAAEKQAERRAEVAAERRERAAAEREASERTKAQVAEAEARADRRRAEAAAAEDARWRELLQDLRDKSGGNSGTIGEISFAEARARITQRADAALRKPMREYTGPADFEAMDRYLAPHLVAAEAEAWHELARELGINVGSLARQGLMPTFPRNLPERPGGRVAFEAEASPVSKTGPVGGKGKGLAVEPVETVEAGKPGKPVEAVEAVVKEPEEEITVLRAPNPDETWAQMEAREARELAAAIELSTRLRQQPGGGGGPITSASAASGSRTGAALTPEAKAKLLQVPTQALDEVSPAEGSASTQPEVPVVAQPEAPFTAQELIDELVGLMPGVPQAPAGLLGPDVFGDRVVPPAPEFLQGYDYRQLKSESRVAFFRALDLVRATAPTAEGLAPETLGQHPESVVESSGIRTMSRSTGSGFLRKWVRIPRLVHSIWLGGPLSADNEHTGPFMTNVQDSADGPGQEFTHVIWTDVTRARVAEARAAEGTGDDTPELATVRAMVTWAGTRPRGNVVLVNVDEVFSAEAPMGLEAAYKMETAKRLGQGYASASDILRLEVLGRFGGIYTDGDNRLRTDPTPAVRRIVESDQGFAVAKVGNAGMANAVLIAPAGHRAVRQHLEVLRRNYLRSSHENTVRGGYFQYLDRMSVSKTDFREADKMAGEDPVWVQGHTEERDKNAVLYLSGTGINIWADLAHGLGLKGPGRLPVVEPGVFEIGVGNTWVPREQPAAEAEPAEGDQQPEAPDRAATLLAARNIINTLIRELSYQNGKLALSEVAARVARHPQPALLWDTVIGFLAGHPELRTRVQWRTVQKYDAGTRPIGAPVPLPPWSAGLLVPEPGEVEGIKTGRGVERVRMLAPEEVPPPAATGVLQVPTQAVDGVVPAVTDLDRAREQLAAVGVGAEEQAAIGARLDDLVAALDEIGAGAEARQGVGTALQMGSFQQAFAGLGQAQRLEVLRLLAQALRDGLEPGAQPMLALLVTVLLAAQQIRDEVPVAAAGESPRDLARRLTTFADGILAGAVAWARESMRGAPTAPYAVVAVAGYGRTDLTPAADLDFGLLGAQADAAWLRSLTNLAAGWLDLARQFLPVNGSAAAPFQADIMWFNPNLAVFDPEAVLEHALAASADELTPKHGVMHDTRLIELAPLTGALAAVTSHEGQRELFRRFAQERSGRGDAEVEWAALRESLAGLPRPETLAQVNSVNVKTGLMRQLTVATRHLYAAYRAVAKPDTPWRLSTGERLEELIAGKVLSGPLGRQLVDAYVLGLSLRQRLHQAYGGERDEVATAQVAEPPNGLERLLPQEQEQLAAAIGVLHEVQGSLGALWSKVQSSAPSRWKTLFGRRPVVDQSVGLVPDTVEPGELWDADLELPLVGGGSVRLGDVQSLTIVAPETGLPQGRAFHTEDELAQRREVLRSFDLGRRWLLEVDGQGRVVTGYRKVPWGTGGRRYLALLHGNRDFAVLPLSGPVGTVKVTATGLARTLRRRPSVQQLAAGDEIVLAACDAALPASDGGPSLAQEVANATGRVVWAPTGKIAALSTDLDADAGFLMYPAADGTPGAWIRFTPNGVDPSQDSEESHPAGVSEVGPVPRGTAPLAPSQSSTGVVMTGVEDSEEEQSESEEDADDLEELDDLDDLEELDPAEGFAWSQQPQHPGNQGEGSGSVQAQVSTVMQPEAPFTAQELINELIDLMPGAPQAPVAPVGLLGPDVFGDRIVPVAPEFLRGYDYRKLKSRSRVGFLRALDLARETAPTAQELTPDTLGLHSGSVVESDQSQTMPRRSGPIHLPKPVRIPRLVHSIWLGGPLSMDNEHTGPFMTNVQHSADGLGEGFTHVIWTDVTRARVAEAKAAAAAGTDDVPAELATVWAMVEWARSRPNRNVVLVNVDEVFSAEAPMGLEAAFKMETAKGLGQGYASASDILRLEVLNRFGGVYTDGDNRLLKDLDPEVRRIVESEQGFAVARASAATTVPGATTSTIGTTTGFTKTTRTSKGGLANAVLIAPAGHRAVRQHLEVLRRNYLRRSNENTVRGVYFQSRKPSHISGADFREAKTWVKTDPGEPTRHTDDGEKNAVLYLSGTGVNIWADLANGLGLKGPDALPLVTSEIFEIGTGNTWVPRERPAAAVRLPEVPDREATLLAARRIINTLIRELSYQSGKLALSEVAARVARHPRPDLLWDTVIGFLAHHPELRERVQWRTVQKLDGATKPTGSPVVLPPWSDSLLVRVEEAKPRAGVERVRMVAPETVAPPASTVPAAGLLQVPTQSVDGVATVVETVVQEQSELDRARELLVAVGADAGERAAIGAGLDRLVAALDGSGASAEDRQGVGTALQMGPFQQAFADLGQTQRLGVLQLLAQALLDGLRPGAQPMVALLVTVLLAAQQIRDEVPVAAPGESPRDLARRLTGFADGIMADAVAWARESMRGEATAPYAVVAVAGYGRTDLTPAADLDFGLLGSQQDAVWLESLTKLAAGWLDLARQFLPVNGTVSAPFQADILWFNPNLVVFDPEAVLEFALAGPGGEPGPTHGVMHDTRLIELAQLPGALAAVTSREGQRELFRTFTEERGQRLDPEVEWIALREAFDRLRRPETLAQANTVDVKADFMRQLTVATRHLYAAYRAVARPETEWRLSTGERLEELITARVLPAALGQRLVDAYRLALSLRQRLHRAYGGEQDKVATVAAAGPLNGLERLLPQEQEQLAVALGALRELEGSLDALWVKVRPPAQAPSRWKNLFGRRPVADQSVGLVPDTVEPAELWDAELELPLVGGGSVRLGDIQSLTIVAPGTGLPQGRAFHTEDELTQRREVLRSFDLGRRWLLEVDGQGQEVTGYRKVPWGTGGRRYLALVHGNRDFAVLPLSGPVGTVKVTATGLARTLRRRPSVQQLAAGDEIVLAACDAALPASDGGPSLAQEVANATGRVVWAPTGKIAALSTDLDADAGFLMYPAADGTPGAWIRFTPNGVGAVSASDESVGASEAGPVSRGTAPQVPSQSSTDVATTDVVEEQPQLPENQGEGSTQAQAQAPEPPFTAQELIDELVSLMPGGPQAPAAPADPLEAMLGPDLFGDRVVPPAPEFLQGYGYDQLKSESRTAFFRALDLASEAATPTAEGLAPKALGQDPESVIESGALQTVRRRSGSMHLPKRVRIPQLVHSIWLGGPLSADNAHTGPFMANVQESADGLGREFTHVIWTDVTRARVAEAAAAAGTGDDTPELATVRAMVAWARSRTHRNVVLVNVDEVFSAEAPMSLEAAYKMETAKGLGQGYASASDILRLEVLDRFGGVYTDGDNRLLKNPVPEVRRIADSKRHFAVATASLADAPGARNGTTARGGLANAVLIAPAGNTAVQEHLRVLRSNYQRSSHQNTFRGEYFRPRGQEDNTEANFQQADVVAGPPVWVQNHTEENEKNAVLHLSGTGVNIWADLAYGLGLSGPGALPVVERGVFEIGVGNTWVPPRPSAVAGVQLPEVPDRAATLLAARRIINTLIRELVYQNGKLALSEVAARVARHPRPDLLWDTVIGFLARHPELRDLVRWRTVRKVGAGTGPADQPVALPPWSAGLLVPESGRVAGFTAGSDVERVRMLAPEEVPPPAVTVPVAGLLQVPTQAVDEVVPVVETVDEVVPVVDAVVQEPTDLDLARELLLAVGTEEAQRVAIGARLDDLLAALAESGADAEGRQGVGRALQMGSFQQAFAGLGQAQRLEVLRLLAQALRDGLEPGAQPVLALLVTVLLAAQQIRDEVPVARAGESPRGLAERLTDFADSVLTDAVGWARESVRGEPTAPYALVAVAGFGRTDLTPAADLDFGFLGAQADAVWLGSLTNLAAAWLNLARQFLPVNRSAPAPFQADIMWFNPDLVLFDPEAVLEFALAAPGKQPGSKHGVMHDTRLIELEPLPGGLAAVTSPEGQRELFRRFTEERGRRIDADSEWIALRDVLDGLKRPEDLAGLNKVDVKTDFMRQLTVATRHLYVAYRAEAKPETPWRLSTGERLKELIDGKVLPAKLGQKLKDAYVLGLRLRQRLHRAYGGERDEVATAQVAEPLRGLERLLPEEQGQLAAALGALCEVEGSLDALWAKVRPPAPAPSRWKSLFRGSGPVADQSGESVPAGEPVVPVEPGELWDVDLELPLVGGGSVRLGDVRSLTIAAPGSGLPQGRAFHTDDELKQRREVLRNFDLGRRWLLEVDGQGREVTGYRKVPWGTGGGRRYLALLHGNRDFAVLPLSGPVGTVKVTATGLARTLRRRPSIQQLAAGDEIVLAACDAALPASDGGLSLAQEVADATGRVVWAPTGRIAALSTDLDADAGFLMYPAADGTPGAWIRFTPNGVESAQASDESMGASEAGPAPRASVPLVPSQSSTDVAMTGVEETDVEGEEEDELPAANSRTDKGKGRVDEAAEEDLDNLERLDLEEAIARSRRPQYPGNQGEGSGSGSAQPSVPVQVVVQPELRFSAQDLIDELIGLMPGVPQASVAPVGLLGPDVFGDRVVPAAPEFLQGYDYRKLKSESRVAFFRALDLASGTAPTAEGLAPEALGLEQGSVVESGRFQTMSRSTGPAFGRKRVRIPRLVHSIWLGGPLSMDNEHTGPFMTNVQDSADGLGQGFTHVIWTDVTRARVAEASAAAGTDRDTPELATVRAMVEWAATRPHGNVVLVNVDEVFSAEAPMSLEAAYKMETAKGLGQGYASASDILRLEVLRRFGGVYTDGDNRLQADPAPVVERIVNARRSFAVAKVGNAGMANAVLIAPARHPGVEQHLEVLRRNYLRSSHENTVRGMYFQSRDRAHITAEEFEEAEEWVGKVPAEAQRHTDDGEKNAVLYLSGTGVNIWADLAHGLGLDGPEALPLVPSEIFEIGTGNTWVPRERPAAAVQLPEVPDRAATLLAARRIINTLIRELSYQSGKLALSEVAARVARHPRPDLLWDTVIGFLARHPELRERVQWRTVQKYDGATKPVGTPVALPPWSDSLLVRVEEAKPRPGVERVRMLRPEDVPPPAATVPTAAPAGQQQVTEEEEATGQEETADGQAGQAPGRQFHAPTGGTGGTDGTTAGTTAPTRGTPQQQAAPQPPAATDPANFPGWQPFTTAQGTAAEPLRPDRTPRPGPGPQTDPNGVVRDHGGWQLKPTAVPGAPITRFPGAWQRPVAAPEWTYYPEDWSADTVLRHVQAAMRNNPSVAPGPDGLDRAVGWSGSLWVEAVLDQQGYILYHHPLPNSPAPYAAWQEEAVVGRGDRVDLFGYPGVLLQRVRFDSGQDGFEFTVRLHLEPSAGMTPAELDAVRQQVRTLMADFTAGQQVGAFDRLLNVGVEFTEEAGDGVTTLPVAPGAVPSLAQVLPRQFREAAGTVDLEFVTGTQLRKSPPVREVHVGGDWTAGLRPSFTAPAWDRPGRGLPPEWGAAEARYAAHHVLRTGTAEVVGEAAAGRPAPEVRRGRFAGVRLNVRVEDGVITDVWGEPHQKLRPQLTAPVAGTEAVLVPAQEVRPPQDAFIRAITARELESFDARRVRLPDGDTETVLTVRLYLDLEARLDLADGPTAAAVEALREAGREGVEKVYNTGQRLPSGDLLRVEVEFVPDRSTAHHTVAVRERQDRANHRTWGLNTGARTIAHEIGHLLGLDDEYREAGSTPRPIHPDDSGIMGGRQTDRFGRPWLDMNHLHEGPLEILAPFAPPAARNLRQLGGVVDEAFGEDRGPTPVGDAPTRARFREEVLRRALYGGPGGRDGHLVPPRGSTRPRPERVPGSQERNGTFKVVGGPADAAATQVGALAGDLPGPRRNRTVFPEHWTADDAVYAAEQAYQHALRTGRVTATGLHSHHWVGEYGGVRIEGRIRAGEFVSFRPSDDQSGLDTPAYMPWRPTGGAFGARVEDLVRYGDRQTLTGVHAEPERAAATAHGVKVGSVLAENDNGTYRADVWFLDAAVTPGAPMAKFPSRWHQHADGETHTLYPKAWTPSRVLSAVERAYAARHTSEPLDSGAERWVGEADGVRIEGITRDGRHLTHRPTARQPLTDWYAPPAASTGPGLRGRRVRTVDGQLGIEVAAPVHLRVAAGATPAAVADARKRLQRAADDFVRQHRAAGDPPVLLTLDFVDTEADALPGAVVTADSLTDGAGLDVLLPGVAGALTPGFSATVAGSAGPATATARAQAGYGQRALVEPELTEPAEPGTGTRPATVTEMAGQQWMIDGAFAPTLAGNAGRGLPTGWTPGEGRYAALQVLAGWRGRRRELVKGRFNGVPIEVRTENGRIVDFRGLPDRSVPAQFTKAVPEPSGQGLVFPTGPRHAPESSSSSSSSSSAPAGAIPQPAQDPATALLPGHASAEAVPDDPAAQPFELRRGPLVPGGEDVTVLVLRVHLDGSGLTGEDARARVAALGARIRDAAARFDNRTRLPDGTPLLVRVEFADATGDPHRTVLLHERSVAQDAGNWHLEISRDALVHQLGRAFGISVTEYAGGGTTHVVPAPSVRVLRELGELADDRLGRLGHDTEDGESPRTEFADGVLEAELGPAVGTRGGHLPSAIGEEGAEQLELVRRHANGTLLVETGAGRRTLFPEHWTAAEARYAVEQAAVDAVRNETFRVTENGIFWQGVYEGVRIEGRSDEDGTVTAFRPAADQRGLVAPAHAPGAGAVDVPSLDGAPVLTPDQLRVFGEQARREGGTGLPPEWTREQTRHAALWVYEQQNGAASGRGRDEILTGAYGDVRIRLLVRNRQIIDYWAEPGQRFDATEPAEPVRVLATAEVRPPVRRFLRSLQAQFIQSYEVRRVVDADGDTRTVLTVRVHLEADGLTGSRAEAERDLDRVRLNAEAGVRDVFGQGLRLPDGSLLEVAIRFVDRDSAHHVVEVRSYTSQEHAQHWGVDSPPRVIGHEVGHLLGLADEYRRRGAGPRPVHPEFGLMTAPGSDIYGRVWYDAGHPVELGVTNPAVSLRPHNLNELGAVLDRVFRTDLRPVPAGEFPVRAAFGEDALRTALFDGPDRTGGYLTPPAESGRRRLPRVGAENPNGTYRADAGEAALDRYRTMFPAHWTAEDAVYAARQAYLHARRTGGISGRGDLAQRWVGEYDGVRIEGRIRSGEFISFRPAEDQSGLTATAPAPEPATLPFGHRVEDLNRYGDRHTLTGFHHRARLRGALAVDPADHGLHLGPVRPPRANGTYRAPVYFLDPGIAPGAPLSEFPSRWRRPENQEARTFYPESWVSEDVLERVDRAYQERLFEEVLPDGAVRWVGVAHDVWIEGVTRDGRHLVHRPTDWQRSRRETGAGAVPVWERPLVRDDVDYSIGYRRVRPGGAGLPDTELVVQVRDHGDLTAEERAGLQRLADEQAAELFPATAQPGGRPVRIRLRFVPEADGPEAMPPVSSFPSAFVRQLRSRLEEAEELVAGLHGAPAPEPPLLTPVTPGTGERPAARTRLQDLEAAGIDAPALDPALARALALADERAEGAERPGGLPAAWTAAEGGHAARMVAREHLAELGDGRTGTVTGRFAGVELRVTLEDGRIVRFEGTPGQTFENQRRPRPAGQRPPALMALRPATGRQLQEAGDDGPHEAVEQEQPAVVEAAPVAPVTPAAVPPVRPPAAFGAAPAVLAAPASTGSAPVSATPPPVVPAGPPPLPALGGLRFDGTGLTGRPPYASSAVRAGSPSDPRESRIPWDTVRALLNRAYRQERGRLLPMLREWLAPEHVAADLLAEADALVAALPSELFAELPHEEDARLLLRAGYVLHGSSADPGEEAAAAEQARAELAAALLDLLEPLRDPAPDPAAVERSLDGLRDAVSALPDPTGAAVRDVLARIARTRTRITATTPLHEANSLVNELADRLIGQDVRRLLGVPTGDGDLEFLAGRIFHEAHVVRDDCFDVRTVRHALRGL